MDDVESGACAPRPCPRGSWGSRALLAWRTGCGSAARTFSARAAAPTAELVPCSSCSSASAAAPWRAGGRWTPCGQALAPPRASGSRAGLCPSASAASSTPCARPRRLPQASFGTSRRTRRLNSGARGACGAFRRDYRGHATAIITPLPKNIFFFLYFNSRALVLYHLRSWEKDGVIHYGIVAAADVSDCCAVVRNYAMNKEEYVHLDREHRLLYERIHEPSLGPLQRHRLQWKQVYILGTRCVGSLVGLLHGKSFRFTARFHLTHTTQISTH